MKKIILAVALAVAGWWQAPAQTKDTKSAPDLPTFQVTVSVTNGAGGSSSLLLKKTTDASIDSLVLKGTGEIKLNYGASPTLFLKADSLYKLESFTINQAPEELTASFPTQPDDKNKGHNTYTKSLGELKKATQIAIVWKAKPEVELTITGTQQMVSDEKAAVLQITPSISGLTVTPVYYKDKDCKEIADETTRKKAGTYYAKIHIDETADYRGLDQVITMVVMKKKELTTTGAVATEILEEGQPLSAAPITGKVTLKDDPQVEINGAWSWLNPNEGVKAGAHTYEAVYIPDSTTLYSPLSMAVSLSAKPVKTVILQQTEGGIVSIENARPDNRYVGADASTAPSVTFVATPHPGYAVKSWKGISPTISEAQEKEVKTTVTIAEDTEVSAEFVKATRLVSLAAVSGGSLKVMNGQDEIASGTKVPVGTNLTLEATPHAGNKVQTSGYKRLATETTTYEGATRFLVDATAQSYEVYATFEAKPAAEHLVKAQSMTHGTLVLKNGTNTVNLNSAVTDGTRLSVVPLPNHGYRLASLTANGQDITNALSFTVDAETKLQAQFEHASYEVTVIQQTGGTINQSTRQADYQDRLTGITATPEKGYKLVHLLVNNQPVEVPYDLTVEGPTILTAVYQKLAILEILNTDEEIVYNGHVNEIAVKTATPLRGFKVTYRQEGGTDQDTIPQNAGTYQVHITRQADEVYAAVDKTIRLTIKPGVPGILAIPASVNDLQNAEATVGGHWSTEKPGDHRPVARSTGEFTTIYFIPDDKNIGYVTATTPTTAKQAIPVTLPASLANGSLQLMNGDIPVTFLTKYAGQTVSLVAKPDAGYRVDWEALQISDNARLSGDHSFTLPSTGTVSISVKNGATLFKPKQTPPVISGKNIQRTYSGEPVMLTAADLGASPSAGWLISYTGQADNASAIAVEAGTYKIFLSREEDEDYAEYGKREAGKLTIVPAPIRQTDIKQPLAGAVLKNSPLSESYLKGGMVWVNGLPVAGQFGWKDAAQAVPAAGPYEVSFTPASANYAIDPDCDLQSYVSLKDAEQVTVTLRTVNNGRLQLQDAEGKEIVLTGNQAQVAAGSLISILPVSGTIGEMTTSDGAQTHIDTAGGITTYTCVAGSADFTLTVTFQTAGIAVSGIRLDASSKTVGIGESFQLIAVVSPADAANKGVSWSSSDATIAAVDGYGRVTALQTGHCRITASTDDGHYTAFCDVTVTETPTGIEALTAQNPVYTQPGWILVEPSRLIRVQIVTMAGVMIYNQEIGGSVRIPVATGLYLVRLSAADQANTLRLRVR